MAVLTSKSLQLTNPTGQQSDQIRLYPIDMYGKRRQISFEFPTGSAAGDAGSTIDLCRTPIGRIRFLPGESKFWCSAGGAGVTMQLGLRSYLYQNAGPVTQPDDPSCLSGGAAIDVSAALNNTPFSAALWKYDIFATDGVPVPGATSRVPAGACGPQLFATFPNGFPANFLLRGHLCLVTE